MAFPPRDAPSQGATRRPAVQPRSVVVRVARLITLAHVGRFSTAGPRSLQACSTPTRPTSARRSTSRLETRRSKAPLDAQRSGVAARSCGRREYSLWLTWQISTAQTRPLQGGGLRHAAARHACNIGARRPISRLETRRREAPFDARRSCVAAWSFGCRRDGFRLTWRIISAHVADLYRPAAQAHKHRPLPAPSRRNWRRHHGSQR